MIFDRRSSAQISEFEDRLSILDSQLKHERQAIFEQCRALIEQKFQDLNDDRLQDAMKTSKL